MSLVLNMVGGASGAGLKDTDAVLVVTVPTGSTVTAAKGGVTLTPTMWVTAADPTLDCAIFSIKSSLFDAVSPWTVTATLGTDTASDTVIIDSNKQYDLELSYTYYLYNSGNECVAITGGWTVASKSSSAAIAVKENTFIRLEGVVNTSQSDRRATCYTTNAIDLTNFSTIKVLYEAWNPAIPAGYTDPFGAFKFGVAAQSSSFTSYNTSNIQGTQITSETAETTLLFDISNFAGGFYVGGMTQNCGVKIYKVWLE